MLCSALYQRIHDVYVTDDLKLDQLTTNGVSQNYPFDLTISRNIITTYFDGIILGLWKYCFNLDILASIGRYCLQSFWLWYGNSDFLFPSFNLHLLNGVFHKEELLLLPYLVLYSVLYLGIGSQKFIVNGSLKIQHYAYLFFNLTYSSFGLENSKVSSSVLLICLYFFICSFSYFLAPQIAWVHFALSLPSPINIHFSKKTQLLLLENHI